MSVHEERLTSALRGSEFDSSPIYVLPEDVRACLAEVKGLRASHVCTNFIERTDRIAVIAAQRRMIAALYWRAGATMVLAARAESRRQHAKCDRLCNAAGGAFSAAQAMEAACAR